MKYIKGLTIYGVAILALCFLLGKISGNLLGRVIQLDGDIGGVGFAMLYLILLNSWMQKKGWMEEATEGGILFWSAMYIPIIVAMSATQNVKAAASGGWLAIFAGIAATAACYLLVPVIAKIGRHPNPQNTADGDH